MCQPERLAFTLLDVQSLQPSVSKPKVTQVCYVITPPHVFFLLSLQFEISNLNLILKLVLLRHLFTQKTELHNANTHKTPAKLSRCFATNLKAV